MDRNKSDLEQLVSSQKEQLSRYEKRLKDVVLAYKGLLKEKEALETSLAAITVNSSKCSSDKNVLAANDEVSATDKCSQLQTQIMTLMNSLATLSAEKSRMEASFQADKKQLRAQVTQKDQRISELQLQVSKAHEHAQIIVNEMEAKWITERREREQETNNHMIMIRELQKLYADERHLKENIEMQLNNLKMKFLSENAENARIKELQAQLLTSREQLKQLERKICLQKEKQLDDGIDDEASASDSGNAFLQQLQKEMQKLKDQHAVAIRNEQKRLHLAEERSKKLASAHEERVANLEARLAELSTTVGTYDRLRQQDQTNIQELKRKLQNIDLLKHAEEDAKEAANEKSHKLSKSKIVEADDTLNVNQIVDEIKRLKKLLLNESAHHKTPIEAQEIFSIGTDHSNCQEQLNRLRQQFEMVQLEALQLRETVQAQKSHISTLQDKVKVLNRNIEEQELELKQQNERKSQVVMDESNKWKDAFLELENECRCKVYEMEQQLQNQRQRSLQLLDEKEQELKTLQLSLDVVNTTNSTADRSLLTHMPSDIASSDAESTAAADAAVGQNCFLKSKKQSFVGDNCHMLHYANEIARKDIEIIGLRKAKYAAETALRKSVQEKVGVQQDLDDKIADLEQQIDRLERCQTREGANLEYLKNVVISFIMTRDADDKQHMLNAISAVLQFTPTEIQTINAAFQKK